MITKTVEECLEQLKQLEDEYLKSFGPEPSIAQIAMVAIFAEVFQKAADRIEALKEPEDGN